MGSGKMNKKEALLTALRSYQSAAIAFSGGVDSSTLIKAAFLALGDRAVAVTAVSELLTPAELKDARDIAARVGIRHIVLTVPDLENRLFVENNKERCYYCKQTRFRLLCDWAKENGFSVVLEGSNLDDAGDYRPGMRALHENDFVASPLVDARLHKPEIRALAKAWDLPVWDKPSAACLASRIAYGIPVTAERLSQVARGEDILRRYFPYGQLRLRHHGDIARIEVESIEIAKFSQPRVREEVVKEIKALGFAFVTIDMEGYRMGSQNEILFQENQ